MSTPKLNQTTCTTQGMYDAKLPDIQPYVGVFADFTVEKLGRTFRVFGYNAIDAGIIGPEKNGFAIAHDNPNALLVDEILKQESGYFGPSRAQKEFPDKVRAMSDEAFLDLLTTGHRARYKNEKSLYRAIGPRKKPSRRAVEVVQPELAFGGAGGGAD